MLRAGFKQLKRQSFPQKYKISELLYEKARKLMEQGKFNEAADHFEQSLSVFTDLKLPKKWEETTPEDISIAKFSHEESKHIENIRLKQFEALAQCYFILKDQYSCIKISDYWLNLTPKCVYALTLRAKARFLTEIVSEIDCVMAWRDLEFAHSLDPTNQDVNKLYQNVRMKLKQYEESKSEYNLLQKKQLELIQQYKKQQMQQQMQQQQQQQISQSQSQYKQQQSQQQPLQQNQQQFQFNLPEYGSDEESSDFEDDFSSEFMNQFQNPSYDYDQELSYEQDPTKPIPVEVSELGKFIETRGMEMVKIYEQNGQKQEASELQDKLKKALAAKKQLEKISQLDFNKPKKKLYQLASNFGIDLLDCSVQNEFKKIQQQNLEDIREWLKQNQWNYTDKITQQQQQELARSELAKIQFKKKNKPQARHKNKFNKKCIPKDSSGVTINNNITYNQTFHQYNDINNKQLIPNEQIKQNQSSIINSEEIDEQINCNGLINLAIFILGIIAILSTLYYSFIR